MILHTIIRAGGIDKSLIRRGEWVSTERGHMRRIYTGETRTIKNRITKKETEQEAYYLEVRKLNHWTYEWYNYTDYRIYWADIKIKLK